MLIDPKKDYTSSNFDEPVPEGNYVAVVESCKYCPKKPEGKAPYYMLTFKIIEGEQNGRKVFDFLSLSTASYCKQVIKRLMVACGITDPMDVDRENGKFTLWVTNKTISIEVEHEEDSRESHKGELRSRVRGFSSVDSTTTSDDDVIHIVIDDDDDDEEEDIPF